MYAQLLIDLFKYLAPFLRNVELAKPMQILYKVNEYCQSLRILFWNCVPEGSWNTAEQQIPDLKTDTHT